MQYIDLTHYVVEGMPVYPGTEPPIIVRANVLEEDGFREKKVTMYSHTGTHVDAPAHILGDGKTLDDYPIESFHGSAVVYVHDPGIKKIEIADLVSVEKELADSDFLLIATGWDRFWGRDEYFGDFPVLTLEAARWLKRFGLKGVGLDVVSADPVLSEGLPVHLELLGEDILIFENLKNLALLPGKLCTFTALPLKLSDADGAPIRAFATT